MPPLSTDPHKALIYRAVHSADSPIYTYPTRFHNIDEAKTYIARTLEGRNFRYGCPSHMSDAEYDKVKDEVLFRVAHKAWQQKQFYLHVGVPDRRALRDAIEHDISRLLPSMPSWPHSFLHAGDAKTYVNTTAESKGFRFTPFANIAPAVYRGYVIFNTARHAWEAGKFELRHVPNGWERRVVLALTDAIDLDIHRLITLIPHWPTFFKHLNAARNFVQDICSASRFRYTGHVDVDLEKFKLYVHFNAAKKAWREGRFVLAMRPDKDALRGADDGHGKMVTRSPESGVHNGAMGAYATPKEMGEGWYNVSTAPYPTRTGNVGLRQVNGGAGTLAKREEASNSVLDTPDGTVVTPITPSDASPTTAPEDCVDELVQSVEHGVVSCLDAEMGKCQAAESESSVADEEMEDVDPFKKLLAERQRLAILKAAFE